jgi:hypothetical protein
MAHHGWILADWLITYDAGFTRRGLGGEVVLRLSDAASIPAPAIVFGAQLSCYVAFLAGAAAVLRGRRLPVWFLALALSPLAFLFMVNEPDAVGRKEVIYLAALAWFVAALQAGVMPRSRGGLIVLAGAGFAATLLHELTFFYLPYFFIAATLAGGPRRTPMLAAAAIGGGSAAAMLLILAAGVPLPGVAICAELLSRGMPPQICHGVLAWTPASPMAAMRDALATAAGLNYTFVYGTAVGLWAAVALLAGVERRLALFAGAAFLFSAPLFLTAIDWGRFLSIHAISIALVGAATLPAAAPGPHEPLTWRRVAAIAALLTVAGSWSVPNCCGSTLSAGLFESLLRAGAGAMP